MSNTINISVELSNHTVEYSQWFKELSFELQEEIKSPCTLKKVKNPKNTQAVDLATAIVITNLSLNLISVFLDIFTFWYNQRNFSKNEKKIIYHDDDGKFEIYLNQASSLEIVKKIETSGTKNITFKIN